MAILKHNKASEDKQLLRLLKRYDITGAPLLSDGEAQ